MTTIGALLFVCLFAGHSATSLSERKLALIHGCVNSSIVLPLKYNLRGAGETSTRLILMMMGMDGEKVLAHNVGGQFQPMRKYSDKIQVLPGGGVKLLSLTPAINGGVFMIEKKSRALNRTKVMDAVGLFVLETDKLWTRANGTIDIGVDPQKPVWYHRPAGMFYMTLFCGTFLYPEGDPPFQVEWLTPSGAVVPSSEYQAREGRFVLYVQEGGEYTCRINRTYWENACLTKQHSATIVLDTERMEHTFIFAGIKQVLTEVDDLKDVADDLNNKFDYLLSHGHDGKH